MKLPVRALGRALSDSPSLRDSAAPAAARSAPLAAPSLTGRTTRCLVPAGRSGGGEPHRHPNRRRLLRHPLPGALVGFCPHLRCRSCRAVGGCGRADDARMGHQLGARGAHLGEMPHAADCRIVPQHQHGGACAVHPHALVRRTTLRPALAGGPFPHPGCLGVRGGVQGCEPAQPGHVPRPGRHRAGFRRAGDGGRTVGVSGQPHRPGTSRRTAGGKFRWGGAHTQPSDQEVQGRHIMSSPDGDRQHLAG